MQADSKRSQNAPMRKRNNQSWWQARRESKLPHEDANAARRGRCGREREDARWSRAEKQPRVAKPTKSAATSGLGHVNSTATLYLQTSNNYLELWKERVEAV